MKKIHINIGDRFNKLTTHAFTAMHSQVIFKCDCGNIITKNINDVRTGKIQSCGCLKQEIIIRRNTKHNLSSTRLYHIWEGMKIRCYNTKHRSYKYYGKKGITICNSWLNFMNFYNWAISNGYKDNLTIDRSNNKGNYEPNNCKWIPFVEQAINTSQVIQITAFNETKPLKEWISDHRCKVCRATIIRRLKRNIAPEIAITHTERIR